MRRILLRADAGAEIGYGHFVRTVALAAMLKDEFDCTIYSRRPGEFQKNEAAGVCPLEELPDGDEGLSQFLGLLRGDEIVVLDNYFYTDDYVRSIRHKGCKVVRVQDFFGRRVEADAVVFPCRDPRRALLRQAFLKDDEADRVQGRWVVTFGGSDPLGLTARFMEAMQARGLDVRTLSGGMSAAEVASLLRSSEGVVCSASSVCYEALACGCKVCAGWYVDNQQDFYAELCGRGLVLPLGDLRGANLPDNVSAAPSDSAIAAQFAEAPRYYRTLMHSLSLEMVAYPDLTPEQSRLVWQARVRPEICRWMTNPEPFDFDTHCRFVESLKTRTDRKYFAFFRNGVLVGSCDLVDIKEGISAERGLFVCPEFQGQGIARLMDCRMDSFAASLGVRMLKAEVISSNERSLRLHESLGYAVTEEKDGMKYMQRTL